MERLSKFKFREEYWSAIKDLPTGAFLRLHKAIVAYGLRGELPNDLNPVENVVFDGLRENFLERDRKKALAGRKGGQHSRGGGAPYGNRNAVKAQN